MAAHIVIAIDGPAASGKSSVARALARRLRYRYENTGAMYRAVTWLAVSRGIPPADTSAVRAMLDSTVIVCGFDATGESTILLDGLDPTPHLNDASVTASVSTVASIPEVRRRLVALQRACCTESDVVMEGRDIGSAVFP